ncbi:MAG: cupin domain-containing protein [Eubacteriales bacterium]|nr:cupin domain-containing protein [Eubacteriales bacterium]
MVEEIKQIAMRIRDMREILDLTPEQVAAGAGMTLEEYQRCEEGTTDISFGVLYNIARVFGVDLTELMTGDVPKLSNVTLTRKDQGFRFNRNEAYGYQHLAYTFRNKKAEPFLVTVEAKPEKEHAEPNTHVGQEFDYLVEGRLVISVDGREYTLEPGDSLYYDSSLPHAMWAKDCKYAKFLAIVMK